MIYKLNKKEKIELERRPSEFEITINGDEYVFFKEIYKGTFKTRWVYEVRMFVFYCEKESKYIAIDGTVDISGEEYGDAVFDDGFYEVAFCDVGTVVIIEVPKQDGGVAIQTRYMKEQKWIEI